MNLLDMIILKIGKKNSGWGNHFTTAEWKYWLRSICL